MFTLADVETALPMVHAAKPNSDDGRMFTTLKPHAQRSATADQGQKATYTVTPTVRPLYSLEQTFLRTVPMSASLIGRLGSSTFRPSAAAVSMSLTGSRFSSESAPRPFHHGIRGQGGAI